jgi:hypothetical protein
VTLGSGGVWAAQVSAPNNPMSPPLGEIHEVVLPGGQPLWLGDHELENFAAAERYSFIAVDGMGAPWAKAWMALEAPKATGRQFLSAIRSDPTSPQRLSVPDSSILSGVAIVTGGVMAASDDPAVIAEVVRRLRALDQPVDPTQPICPGGPTVGPVWTLAAEHMARLSLMVTDTDEVTRVEATIAIGTSSSCSFATASDGGRVWVPAELAAELHELVETGR